MSGRRSILLLGGSAAQVEAIDKARELGYRTVLCDYLPDNPGRCHADSFHLVSTTDREAVLGVARAERVEGVVAYGSDPAAPTAAYVAELMGLPGNPYEAVSMLCDKERFRGMLRQEGFPAPRFFATGGSADADELVARAGELACPVVVKPVDSSGSKGVSVVRSPDDVPGAVSRAIACSRKGRAIVEQFVPEVDGGIVEAEIFVVDGIVESWVLMRSARGGGRASIVPTVSIHPPRIPLEWEASIRREIQRLVTAAGIGDGPMNIEMAVGGGGEVYFLDVGPRNGGNLLARFASLASGKDVVAATVESAMGGVRPEDVAYGGSPGCTWVQHILGSSNPGVFRRVREGYPGAGELVELHLFKEPGDSVDALVDASCEVGVAFLRFPAGASVEEVVLAVEDPCEVEDAALDGAGGCDGENR